MAKEFNKKYMHPTRRKLVDMVLHGKEYETDTRISFADTDIGRKREVGEIWTDADGVQWEQRSYGRVQLSELTETMSSVRNWIADRNRCKNTTCEKSKYGHTDKKLIRKTGYCTNCLADKEAKIKYDGMWEWYEKYRITQNMLAHGNEVLLQLRQAYNDVKPEYEVVNEDGTIEKWKMEKSVDDLKSEILEDISNIEKEVSDVLKIRDEAWEKLKDRNYELVTPPNI
jgi:hypothetical protein